MTRENSDKITHKHKWIDSHYFVQTVCGLSYMVGHICMHASNSTLVTSGLDTTANMVETEI